MAQKPITVSIDTINDDSRCIYNNIRKGDTLQMFIKIFQGSNNLNLTGQSMHIVLKKADGYSVEKIVNNVTGNSFYVTFDVQATLAVGDVEGIIEISDSSGTDITNTFNFEVRENPSTDIVIKSADQIETLSQIVALINTYNANADNLATQNALALTNITTIEGDIATGNTLDARIKDDIAIGTPLDTVLKSDISIGQALDILLKSTITTGNTTNNTLLTSITNGNEVIANLASVNWSTVQSYIGLMETILAGMPLTNENDINLTDENDIALTM